MIDYVIQDLPGEDHVAQITSITLAARLPIESVAMPLAMPYAKCGQI
ncbi:MAG: hypothetical protein V8Q36_10850 [Anaerotignum sp.]